MRLRRGVVEGVGSFSVLSLWLKKVLQKKDFSVLKSYKSSHGSNLGIELKLNKLPKNSAKIRVRNRCEVSGRPHGVYRKLKISRIALRQLGLQGKIPGLVKSSW